MQQPNDPSTLRGYARRVWIAVGITVGTGVVLMLLWLGLEVVLMTLAGLLLALFFYIPSDWLARHSFLSYRGALAVVLLVLAGALVLFSLNFASNITQQSQQLAQILPDSIEALEEEARQWPMGAQIIDMVEQERSTSNAFGSWFSRATSIFTTTLGAMVNVVITLFIGLFIAFEPWTYRNGLMSLVFPQRRETVRILLKAIVSKMSWWLLGRLAAMVAVGGLTGVGLWILEIPMALSLSLLAGILNFIPYLGPIISAVPALLVAFTLGHETLLYVAGLYFAVQAMESYLITPYVEREAVNVPPGLLIVVQVWLGLFAGILGLLLAGPLTALTMLLTRHVYVEGWLKNHASPSEAGDN